MKAVRELTEQESDCREAKLPFSEKRPRTAELVRENERLKLSLKPFKV